MSHLESYLLEQIKHKENELVSIIHEDNYIIGARLDRIGVITKELRELYDLLFIVNEHSYNKRF